MNNKSTHTSRLLAYLRTYGKITSLDAIQKLGNTRLAASIFILKDEGYEFETINLDVTTRYGSTTVAQYKLIEE